MGPSCYDDPNDGEAHRKIKHGVDGPAYQNCIAFWVDAEKFADLGSWP